jgi:hypothetical protein
MKGPVCQLCGCPIHREAEARVKTHKPPTEKTRWAHVGWIGQRHRAVPPSLSAPELNVAGPRNPRGHPVPPVGVALLTSEEPATGKAGADERAERCWEEDP